MPKRVPAIPDDILRCEVGHLADDVLLLPVQVTLLTGLSVGQLKERLRTRPPQAAASGAPGEAERSPLVFTR